MMRIVVFIPAQHKCMAVATEEPNTRYDLYHSASKYSAPCFKAMGAGEV